MTLPADYFELLSVARRFEIDEDELESRYREESKKVHPDRHVGAEAGVRVRALQDSMNLNQAYQTLKNLAKRAEYLLGIYGVEIGEHERIDPELIMDILDAREELSGAIARNEEAELERLEEAMLNRKDCLLEDVARLFAEAETPPSRATLDSIKGKLILLRYVERYLEQFDGIDDERAA